MNTSTRYTSGSPFGLLPPSSEKGLIGVTGSIPTIMRWYKGYVIALFPDHPYEGHTLYHCYDLIGGWDHADYNAMIRHSRPATEGEYLATENALTALGLDIRIVPRRPAFRQPKETQADALPNTPQEIYYDLQEAVTLLRGIINAWTAHEKLTQWIIDASAFERGCSDDYGI